jgi:hypothetical protein
MGENVKIQTVLMSKLTIFYQHKVSLQELNCYMQKDRQNKSNSCFYKFYVRKSTHHHTIQINQPTRCNSFTSLLLDVYVWLNTFRASPRPSSGAYNCTRSLWYYRYSVAVGALLIVVCQTTTNNTPTATLQR